MPPDYRMQLLPVGDWLGWARLGSFLRLDNLQNYAVSSTAQARAYLGQRYRSAYMRAALREKRCLCVRVFCEALAVQERSLADVLPVVFTRPLQCCSDAFHTL